MSPEITVAYNIISYLQPLPLVSTKYSSISNKLSTVLRVTSKTIVEHVLRVTLSPEMEC